MDRLTKLAMLRNPELAHMHMANALADLIEKGKGEKGDAPVKYVDYFTPSEIQEMLDYLETRLVHGKDGENGTDGETPVKGIHYRDGIDGDDGKTPVKGKDYFTKKEVDAIVKAAAKLVEVPPVPKAKDIHAELDKRLKGTYAPVKDLEDLIKFLKAGGFRGGAGSSGGNTSTTTITQYQLTAIQSGFNVTIALNQLAHFATLTNIINVYRNNMPQTLGIDFTISGGTVTVNGADASEIFNITYSYA